MEHRCAGGNAAETYLCAQSVRRWFAGVQQDAMKWEGAREMTDTCSHTGSHSLAARRLGGMLLACALVLSCGLTLVGISGCAWQPPATQPSSPNATAAQSTASVSEDGSYVSKTEVASYLHAFGHLPGNYIAKPDARRAGWDARAGNLDEVAPGMSIGGDRYYNDDGALPETPGRKYFECDIDYQGGHRGAKRIVFSDDGLVFYTDDHYKTFEQLY